MDRHREIAFLLLRQSLHTSQHFYTFLPYSIRPRNEYLLSPLPKRENKFAITIHHDSCDPLSKEANTYLLRLLRYNLSTLYHRIPETAMATLREIASLFLDYEYINNSQGFFTACNSSGNRTSYGYNFSLFFVFLHNFSSSSLMNSSSLSQHSVEFDYFLVSPDSFRSSNINSIDSVQRDLQGPNQRQEQEQEQEQELDIQNLFKSCFMYSIYNTIYSNRSVKPSELKRFLTADNCLSKDINVDMTHLLRVFRVLNDDDRKYIDDEVYRSINLTDCIIFDEYLVVRFNDYPVFIKPELVYQRRIPGTKEVCSISLFIHSIGDHSVLSTIIYGLPVVYFLPREEFEFPHHQDGASNRFVLSASRHFDSSRPAMLLSRLPLQRRKLRLRKEIRRGQSALPGPIPGLKVKHSLRICWVDRWCNTAFPLTQSSKS